MLAADAFKNNGSIQTLNGSNEMGAMQVSRGLACAD